MGAATVRRHNLAVVTRLLAARQPRLPSDRGAADDPGGENREHTLSRAGLAAAAGMTRATAGSLVEELLLAGLVRELGPAGLQLGAASPGATAGARSPGRAVASAGRPGTGVELNGAGAYGLGLEINVDYLAATLLDLSGHVRYREVTSQDQRSVPPEQVLARLGRLAARAVSAAAGGPIAGAAVAVPGLVEVESGRVRAAPNLGWRDVAVTSVLARDRAFTGLSLRLGNEADYSALAELASPTAPVGDFVLVSGEVGIGAGILVDGALLAGRHGWGGELGHVTIAADGPPCACGSRGCLETFAGQDAILRAAGVDAPSVTALGGTPTVELMTAGARAGDPAMIAALAAAGQALGIAVAGVLNLLDIPTVVLGGIYAPLAPWIASAVERELALRVVWADWSPPVVLVSPLRPGAACQGAATAVIRSVIEDPAGWMEWRRTMDLESD